jgi:hypothetical protein
MKRCIAAILMAVSAGLLTMPVSMDGRAQTSAPSAAGPRISGFDVQPVGQPAPGNELLFTLYGSPGGSARVQIAGAGSVVLDEVDPGVYEGAYTIRQRDRITPATTATVNLRGRQPGREQRARRIADRRARPRRVRGVIGARRSRRLAADRALRRRAGEPSRAGRRPVLHGAAELRAAAPAFGSPD